MDTVWSTYIQKIGTLYESRQLRFADLFQDKYRKAFSIDGKQTILEIGCGPGALTQALQRWYPDAHVTGVDKDTNFIKFAKEKAPDLTFQEDDATQLSFDDDSFDVSISNTVQEHIEPSKFFGEQYRVLKPGGICLVLSARRGIHLSAPCIIEDTEFEKNIWNRTEAYFHELNQKYKVCAYPMSEAELPMAMTHYGFREVSTEYLTINLTPDNPAYSKETAHAIINANRQSGLDNIDGLEEIITASELTEMKRLHNAKYNKRLELYENGMKQWDTNVSLTMVVRGIK